ncbi:hypothetical protein Q9233_011811 [Columba guinea]|nr:hypothetical protein Q9233_011811 [Columba guinea]
MVVALVIACRSSEQILVIWVRTRRDIQKLGFMNVMKEGDEGAVYCYVNMSHLSSLAFSTTPLAILESDGIYRDGISFFHPFIPRVCSYWSVLRPPFQILNTTQLNNSIFSQDRMGVSAEGLEDYSLNPSLKFGHWSMAGSHHDIVDLVSWIQAQLTDMKLGRNVARTFLDYYRLNSLVERPLTSTPKTRKENLQLFKGTAQCGQGSSPGDGKPEKRGQARLKERAQSRSTR